jgi:mono/diheme cytochrome c family protein
MRHLGPWLFGVPSIFTLFVVYAPAAIAAEYTAVEVLEATLVPDYVGSQSCAACHGSQTQEWEGSDHALA